MSYIRVQQAKKISVISAVIKKIYYSEYDHYLIGLDRKKEP